MGLSGAGSHAVAFLSTLNVWEAFLRLAGPCFQPGIQGRNTSKGEEQWHRR